MLLSRQYGKYGRLGGPWRRGAPQLEEARIHHPGRRRPVRGVQTETSRTIHAFAEAPAGRNALLGVVGVVDVRISDSGGAATARLNFTVLGAPGAPGQHSTVRMVLGGAAVEAGAALSWPMAETGGGAPAVAAWFEASVPLVQAGGYRVRPFDAYTLSLAPLTAQLVACQGPGSAGGCTRVALPVHAAFAGSAAAGFRVTPLPPHLAGGMGSGGADGGSGAPLGGLLVCRATSQRTLRLMAQMLQLAVGGYLAAWAAGALVWQWLMGRALSRIHHVL